MRNWRIYFILFFILAALINAISKSDQVFFEIIVKLLFQLYFLIYEGLYAYLFDKPMFIFATYKLEKIPSEDWNKLIRVSAFWIHLGLFVLLLY
jgi:hypothetical protein